MAAAAWVPPLEDDACHDEHLHAPVLRGAQHALLLLQSDCTTHARQLLPAALALASVSCVIWVCNQHRGALSGIPGSACPQPEPNATELPSCARISARAAQRQRRRRRWRGEEGTRRPGPEGQVLRHVLSYVLRNALRRVLHVLVLYVSSKGGRVRGLASGSPRAVATRTRTNATSYGTEASAAG